MQKSLKSLFGDHHGLDEKSIKFLIQALEKSNLPGFDYIEFRQSMQALSELNMEEPVIYKSAFATASTLGLTKERLIQTAEHYKKVLANEKVQFDAALQKQVKQRVDSKQEEVERLRKQVDEYKSKIKQLEEKIEKAETTIEKADDVIRTSMEKIESTKDGFEFTLQSLLNAIDRDIENIETFL